MISTTHKVFPSFATLLKGGGGGKAAKIQIEIALKGLSFWFSMEDLEGVHNNRTEET